MWYIFRHGETIYNKSNITQGSTTDSFLTMRGALQVYLNGKKLRTIEKDTDFHNYRFICTSFLRTYHSCQILLESLGITDIIPIEEELLSSRGKIGHLKKDDNKPLYGNTWNFSKDGEETHKSTFIRISKFIEKNKHEKNLVIVAHAGINRSLMYLLQQSKTIDNLSQWVENITDEEGNNIIFNIRTNMQKFEQEYFYSWDWNNFKKI